MAPLLCAGHGLALDYHCPFTPSALKNLVPRLKPFVKSGAKIPLLGATALVPRLENTDARVIWFDRSISGEAQNRPVDIR